VHFNPSVRATTGRLLQGVERIHLIEPLPYPDFIGLINRARLILTDSGGIQEEALSLGKPTLILRDTTERPEILRAGVARLVGAGGSRLVNEVIRLLDQPEEYDRMAQRCADFGDGHAAQRIADILLESGLAGGDQARR
jgi:UDP-N-acetylglucosamine 2-epimerase (non-hydrolysing)